MGLGREYKVVLKDYHRTIDRKTFRTLPEAVKHVLSALQHYRNLDQYNRGVFVITQNTFTGELVKKRYRIITMFPYTEIQLIKMTKGSFNTDEVMGVFERIKEIYFNERI